MLAKLERRWNSALRPAPRTALATSSIHGRKMVIDDGVRARLCGRSLYTVRLLLGSRVRSVMQRNWIHLREGQLLQWNIVAALCDMVLSEACRSYYHVAVSLSDAEPVEAGSLAMVSCEWVAP